jgi:hypothetical protein
MTLQTNSYRLALAALLFSAGTVAARLAPATADFWLYEADPARLTLTSGFNLTTLDTDSTRIEAHGALLYGLSESLSATVLFPYKSETYNELSKSGQEDLIFGLRYRQPFGEQLWFGFSETVSITTGFKEKLQGFDNWGHPVPRYESRLHLEGLSLPASDSHRMQVALSIGLRTDAHRANTVIQWDTKLQLDFWQKRLRVEGEFAQEMTTLDKEFEHQMRASFSGTLPWNLRLGLGFVQTTFHGRNPFGFSTFLTWSHQKQQRPTRVLHRLLPSLQSVLDRKNQIQINTMEPTLTDGLLANAGRIPFQPLNLALVNMDGSSLLASEFSLSLRQDLEADSLFALRPTEDVQRALNRLHLDPELELTYRQLQALSIALHADMLLIVHQVRHELDTEQASLILLRTKHLVGNLNARLELFEGASTSPRHRLHKNWTTKGKTHLSFRPADKLGRNSLEESRLVQDLVQEATTHLRYELLYTAEVIESEE